MSILKVNTIQDKGGNTLLVSDGAGTISSGGAITNTPAFEASLSSNQTISSGTATKVQFNQENLDTDNNYDNSTNYRFTPTTAGKYFVFLDIGINTNADSNMNDNHCFIYKNGSIEKRSHFNFRANAPRFGTVSLSTIIDLNGTDYIEAYAECNDSSGSPTIQASPYTRFGAYKLIGA